MWADVLAKLNSQELDFKPLKHTYRANAHTLNAPLHTTNTTNTKQTKPKIGKREVGTISEAPPHLIFDRLSSPLGRRITTMLKHLFPAPKVCLCVLCLLVLLFWVLVLGFAEAFCEAGGVRGLMTCLPC